MTHGSIPSEERIRCRIKDNLVRLSIGIEDKFDLRDDMENALGSQELAEVRGIISRSKLR